MHSSSSSGLALRAATLVLAAVTVLVAAPAEAQIRPDNLVTPPLKFTPVIPSPQQLKNGLTLYLLEDHEVPLVQGFAYVRGGSLWERADRIGLASMTGTVMRTGGAGKMSADELDRRLEFLAASIEAGFGDEFGSAGFSCLAENVPEVCGYFADVLRFPRFEESRIEVARTQALDGIRRRLDYPESIAGLVFDGLLYGLDSPYARFPTEASVKAITRQDMLEFHRKWWVPSNITLAVYGDFKAKSLKDLLNKLLGAWRDHTGPQPPYPPVPPEPKPGFYFVEKKGLQQATIVMGHLGPARNSPYHHTLIPLDYVLGTGGFNSRLMRELRSNRGLTYGAGGGVFEGVVRGSLQVSLQTANETTAEAVQACRDLLAAFSTITPDERRTAFNALENSFVFRFNSTGQLLAQTVLKRLQGFPADYWSTYLEKLRDVTDPQIAAAAKELIHPDQLVVLVVGDREGLQNQLDQLGPFTELPLPK